jgi:hypothetical protein
MPTRNRSWAARFWAPNGLGAFYFGAFYFFDAYSFLRSHTMWATVFLFVNLHTCAFVPLRFRQAPGGDATAMNFEWVSSATMASIALAVLVARYRSSPRLTALCGTALLPGSFVLNSISVLFCLNPGRCAGQINYIDLIGGALVFVVLPVRACLRFLRAEQAKIASNPESAEQS